MSNINVPEAIKNMRRLSYDDRKKVTQGKRMTSTEKWQGNTYKVEVYEWQGKQYLVQMTKVS